LLIYSEILIGTICNAQQYN